MSTRFIYVGGRVVRCDRHGVSCRAASYDVLRRSPETDARPGRNSSRHGRPRPSLHGPRRADKFTDALSDPSLSISVDSRIRNLIMRFVNRLLTLISRLTRHKTELPDRERVTVDQLCVRCTRFELRMFLVHVSPPSMPASSRRPTRRSQRDPGTSSPLSVPIRTQPASGGGSVRFGRRGGRAGPGSHGRVAGLTGPH